jgi:hypothetical protein
MIALTGNSITTQTTSFKGQSTTVVTDTLLVAEARIDFTSGAIYAIIRRGTMAAGQFQPNQPDLSICANPDGSVVSPDGSIAGTIAGGIAALVASLKSQGDQMVLGAGIVTGTAI